MHRDKMISVIAGWLIVFPAAYGVADSARAETTETSLAQEDRIAELERTVAVLADELERTRRDLAIPEEHELVARYGRADAASRIYDVNRGLSIGGYGEGYYRKLVDDDGGNKDRADLLRMVLYTGYKFTDHILFNAEIEFEHATTSSTESSGNGSVSVEFAHLDFLLKNWFNVRAGLVLVPMGYINEIHEPTSYFGVNRPEVERQIIPATWRENGVGVLGTLFEQLEYEAYVVNGFNAEGFDSSGLRGGRQKGNRALAEHLAFVARFDWTPIAPLEIGGSVYHGKSGQNQNVRVSAGDDFDAYSVDIPDTPTTVWEVHAQYENRGLHLRSLFTMAEIGDNTALTRALAPVGDGGGTGVFDDDEEGVGGEMLGVYGEVAYELIPLFFPDSEKSLEPFFRFEYYDTQRDMPSGFSKDKSKEIQVYTLGFSFKPTANVVIKADYRNRVAESGGLPDEFNLGMGFVF
jgi:opacity protein-like surface antigen